MRPVQIPDRERKQWETLKSQPLQFALKHAPLAVLVLGAGAFLFTLCVILPAPPACP